MVASARDSIPACFKERYTAMHPPAEELMTKSRKTTCDKPRRSRTCADCGSPDRWEQRTWTHRMQPRTFWRAHDELLHTQWRGYINRAHSAMPHGVTQIVTNSLQTPYELMQWPLVTMQINADAAVTLSFYVSRTK